MNTYRTPWDSCTQERARRERQLQALPLLPIQRRVLSLFDNPELRRFMPPRMMQMGKQLLRDPGSEGLKELFLANAARLEAYVLALSDPFAANYPRPGTLPSGEGRIVLLTMPTGDVLSLEPGHLTCHLALLGPSGSGKTRLAMRLILEALKIS